MSVKHSRDVTEENMQVISYMYFSLQKMNLTNLIKTYRKGLPIVAHPM